MSIVNNHPEPPKTTQTQNKTMKYNGYDELTESIAKESIEDFKKQNYETLHESIHGNIRKSKITEKTKTNLKIIEESDNDLSDLKIKTDDNHADELISKIAYRLLYMDVSDRIVFM